jgi:hypothetical protein
MGLKIIRNAISVIPPKPMTVNAQGRPLAITLANSAAHTGWTAGCRRLPMA